MYFQPAYVVPSTLCFSVAILPSFIGEPFFSNIKFGSPKCTRVVSYITRFSHRSLAVQSAEYFVCNNRIFWCCVFVRSSATSFIRKSTRTRRGKVYDSLTISVFRGLSKLLIKMEYTDCLNMCCAVKSMLVPHILDIKEPFYYFSVDLVGKHNICFLRNFLT